MENQKLILLKSKPFLLYFKYLLSLLANMKC